MKPKKHSTRVLRVAVTTLLIGVTILWRVQSYPSEARDSQSSDKQSKTSSSGGTRSQSEIGKQVQIDLDKAVRVALPELNGDLMPADFQTPDGKSGWIVKLPGNRPIATPAYWDGKLFVGGGYGSHEFYAINAETGAVVWQIKTSDDGPTAAVVEDGCVAFNTESCTVVVCDAKSGKVLWQEWLGDPLMSQPAIYNHRLYIAHPAGQRNSNASQQSSSSDRSSYRLLCADLKTGTHIWDQEIPSDVISAPILDSGRVHFTCFDGTSFCLTANNGTLVWKKANSGTSAPLVAGAEVIQTIKVQGSIIPLEGLKKIDSNNGNEKDKKLLGQSDAKYLDKNKGGLIGGAGPGAGAGVSSAEVVQIDASVGFSSPPPAAKLDAANKQVGVSTVVGGWSYQGSRPAFSRGRMMNAQGRFLNSIHTTDGKLSWRAEVAGAGVNGDSQVFSPPALGGQYLYLCSLSGHLLSIRQSDGEIGRLYMFKQLMAFQPALARGNIYVGTFNGLLICLKLGDPDVDGWYAWGGNAQHNKIGL